MEIAINIVFNFDLLTPFSKSFSLVNAAVIAIDIISIITLFIIVSG